jgi:exodeoxyribonuclease V
MLSDHLAATILSKISENPTLSQERLASTLARFTTIHEGDILLIIRGYAGTGKTTEISAYVKMLKEMQMKSILLAPTGRAAKVLSSYSGEQAYTIHKKIYRQRSSKDGFGRFVLDKNLHTNTVFIVMKLP